MVRRKETSISTRPSTATSWGLRGREGKRWRREGEGSGGRRERQRGNGEEEMGKKMEEEKAAFVHDYVMKQQRSSSGKTWSTFFFFFRNCYSSCRVFLLKRLFLCFAPWISWTFCPVLCISPPDFSLPHACVSSSVILCCVVTPDSLLHFLNHSCILSLCRVLGAVVFFPHDFLHPTLHLCIFSQFLLFFFPFIFLGSMGFFLDFVIKKCFCSPSLGE